MKTLENDVSGAKQRNRMMSVYGCVCVYASSKGGISAINTVMIRFNFVSLVGSCRDYTFVCNLKHEKEGRQPLRG
jgi:hypothetical protein